MEGLSWRGQPWVRVHLPSNHGKATTVESQPLSVLPPHRLATVVRCPGASLQGRGTRRGLSPWAGKRYSHKLEGWQLIKDPRLQTGEDVSRYVSVGDREQ